MKYSKGVPFELLPVVGVGDGDQGRCPLAQVLAVQVGNPIFSNHIMHMGPAGGDAGTGLELGDDPGLAPAGH